ncbi:hypothetical protein ACFOZ7_17640 [Natribaculum luteum]|uniref:Transposase n=1 Tax=Natribaculum luteum TaxID=1586232 RepID=A0ABD5P335_9EURY|nr:hypothetical protein [Natribaculum luteum]
MPAELRVKKDRYPDCGTGKCPTHHRGGCSGVIASDSEDRWECTKCGDGISRDTKYTNCRRRLTGSISVVHNPVGWFRS